MLSDTILALLLAFVVCAAICPYAIPILHRMKFGQQVRDDGPQAHLKKSGTPTMGGIMIVLAILAGTAPFIRREPETVPVLLFTAAFGFIGFLDDFLKIRKRQSEGLTVKQKLLLQLLATALLAVWLYGRPELRALLVPFTGSLTGGFLLQLGWLYVPAVFFVVLGTDNGVNFTDGLDGLCSSVTVVVSLFFAAAAIREQILIAPVAGAVTGALLAFLLFNCYPAKVFMGDTGALALGAYVASMALVMRMPLFIPVVGFIYLIEVISVMIQVGYFKWTHGKRFFRMAPIHHHFELGGWSETRVVTVFSVTTAILSLIAWLGMGL
ncbi:phospho-N-acetylmuramoyl-pentapeptide-transferase [Fusobacterium naviforme]|uniref:Phospho-N-acetylmuramoyl-pentapeptide-transferase n=1 Tax=Moryella indoligenes TaxID=371674 RepID=A0AAE3V905_9FIRM|nr:phospho-N-acetylmuramoyl-pentapeptide-transferase [Moryella indoligenes]KAB0578803.1 phospho-N-acetylmuramoyl-pentapeptide-transferase [Fusobacterium naviforme]MDQ0151941.1 phospho-N-acetylmuramoyl-pentapeptide-transferase [Moryella indoligenes]PSL11576.1 phospho-N-acetylmuramoyl-pentapeptide-transferase [Fusobacterium naviforme]STO26658.1 Phospho-N-acetylmuramoyl-pentapeptide-transferase [Fusobacterium naviforme]